MPGGSGNIKPEDGRQFSKSYQPETKWTQKKADKLGIELIEWLSIEENILFEEFLVMEKGLYPELIAYLSNKFSSFLKLVAKAKKIQEIKITKYGLADRLNASMAKFILSTAHGMHEKTSVEQKVKIEKPLIIKHNDKEIDL